MGMPFQGGLEIGAGVPRALPSAGFGEGRWPLEAGCAPGIRKSLEKNGTIPRFMERNVFQELDTYGDREPDRRPKGVPHICFTPSRAVRMAGPKARPHTQPRATPWET